MPQGTERRPGGRHRQAAAHRHRAPRISLRHLLITSERGQTVALAAAVGAALLAGVTGSHSAAAHRPTATATPAAAAPAAAAPAATGPAATGPSAAGRTATAPAATGALPAAGSQRGTDFTYPGDGLDIEEGDPPGTFAPAAIAAESIRKKERPLAVATKPVAGGAAWVDPNPAARVTSCFGRRWGRLHAGVDLAAPDGTPIVAAGAGVVVRAGVAEGYGNAVLIDHGNGFLTHYGHLSVITVIVGQHVAAGEQIGNEGSTGHSTGPHLHFEVHQGYYQNPIEPTAWMREHGVDIPGCPAA